MAPRKRKAAEEQKPVIPIATPSRVTRSATVGRVTRSMTQIGKAKLAVSPRRALRKTKKGETSKKRKNAKPKDKPEDSEDEEAEEEEKTQKGEGTESAEQEDEAGGSKNEKAEQEEETEKEKGTEDPETEDKADDSKSDPGEDEDKTKKRKGTEDTGVSAAKTIIIEHCTQNASFKNKAAQVKARLEQDGSDINVILNPEKPRKGCFEIREDGGETFISLLNIKRPFKRVKDLVVDQVISDIHGKING